MKIHDRFEAASKTTQLQPQMGGSRGSMPPNSNKLNSIYSLQQAAGYNSLSINQVGATGLTLNAGVRGGTLIVTREDFNIEDIHCQMVNKIQRNN